MLKINSDRISDMFCGVGADIYRKAEKCILDCGMDKMIEQGVLLGLSGGADSVMLLCLLVEYRNRIGKDFRLTAVHVNHSIRGEEADADENFCRELCQKLGIEFICEKRDVPSIAANRNIGVEQAAREARYSIFGDIIQGRNDLSAIAVAHNMSDNCETVLFNILRGSGARGASGIRPVRDNIIRPLIGVSKKEILSVLDNTGLPYVTDSTNLSDEYSRNLVRHAIIPSLERLTPEPEKMISRFSENLRSDDEFISQMAADFIRSKEKITNSDLASLHFALFVRVLTLMSGYDAGYLSSAVAHDIYDLLDKDNFVYSLFGDKKFICERGVCSVDVIDEDVDYRIEILEESTFVPQFNADFILTSNKNEEISSNVYKNSIQANLSSAIIDGSLYLRPKKDGDTVYYGGMTHKVKKLFCDKKIPLSLRRTMPLLCDSKGVVWVPGLAVRDDGVPREERCELYAVLAEKK